jgi:hypothetical protein
MLNLLLLTAGTWTAISLLFVWRLASAIPLDSDPASDSSPADGEAPASPRAPAPLKVKREREPSFVSELLKPGVPPRDLERAPHRDSRVWAGLGRSRAGFPGITAPT